jgi:hypothetical protein
MKIKFSKVLSTTQFIQYIINGMNGKIVFDGEFVEGMKVGIHVPRALFLEYHDHGRIIWVGNMADDTYVEQFLNNFLNSFL